MINDKAEGPVSVNMQTSADQASLSQQAFADPKDFLKVLQADFGKIKAAGSQTIIKDDLINYEHTGQDPEGRLAAKIAADHFDDLVKMAQQSPMYGHFATRDGRPVKELYKSDFGLELSLYDGKMGWKLAKYEIGSGLAIATGAGVGIGMAGMSAAFFGSGNPILGLMSGAVTVESVGLVSAIGKDMVTVPGKIREQITADQKLFRSWNGLNG